MRSRHAASAVNGEHPNPAVHASAVLRSVESLSGNAAECRRALEEDFDLLDRVEDGNSPAVRVWTCAQAAVVIGVGQNAAVEVDMEHCRRSGVGVLRRASGGGAVVIGAGTLQYAFALPYTLSPALRDIAASKAFCNRMLMRALAEAGIGADLHADPGGDLKVGDRKAGGVALKRRRRAMLLHGTILTAADIGALSRALRQPSREPAYRAGRSHQQFLINLGTVEEDVLAAALEALLKTPG